MVNKKGFLRIVEAFIAIILITGVLILFYSQTIDKPRKADEVYRFQKTLLDEIAFSESLRNAVLANNTNIISDYVGSRVLGTGFNYSVRICPINDICGLEVYKKEFYSKDRIIGSNLTSYNPVKVKIFMWIE